METPEQRAERVFKEDDEKHERDIQQELRERQQKRYAVVMKHKEALDAMLVPHCRGIRFREYFHKYVFHTASVVFQTEEHEYKRIGKVGRQRWSSYEEHIKARFTTDELGVVGDIMDEFGAYDY